MGVQLDTQVFRGSVPRGDLVSYSQLLVKPGLKGTRGERGHAVFLGAKTSWLPSAYLTKIVQSKFTIASASTMLEAE